MNKRRKDYVARLKRGQNATAGEYALPWGSLRQKHLRRDFLNRVNELTECECYDDLMEACLHLMPPQVGQLEVDLATGADAPWIRAIQDWQAKWHMHAVNPTDEWIFSTAVQTLFHRQLWEARGGPSPYVNGLPRDTKPVPRSWLPPIQDGGGYPHYDDFHAQTNLALESRAHAKWRLLDQFDAWVERFLDEAEGLAKQAGAEKEARLRERETSLTERLGWVVLYQVCGKSHLWIHESSHTRVDPTRVWRAIHETATFIGLRLRARTPEH